MKVELDLSNYATKTNLKNATGIDTWNFSKKLDLPNLKSNIGKLHIDQIKNIPANLNNLIADKLVPVPVHLKK